MSKTVSVSSSKESASNKKGKKNLAKPITITVPDELRRDIKKYENLKVSAICQRALQEAVNEERVKNLDENEISLGAERLMKQMGGCPKNSVSDFMDDCYEAGQTWASKEASIEELKEGFEGKGVGDIQLIFGNECSMVPSETLEADKDNELFFRFYDGARDMWIEIKNVLEAKGYEF